MQPLVDTHCHIDVDVFDGQREALLEAAWRAGVAAIVIPAIVSADFDSLFEVAITDRRLLASVGLHPLFMKQHSEADLKRVSQLAPHESIVAIGECGLDYTDKTFDRNAQKSLFTRHVDLAASCDKPLLIHANKAVEDVILTLQRFPAGFTRGIVHSFNGSQQQAERLIELGFILGFGGAITYPRATRLRHLVTQLPLESLVLETDAPFQTGFRHHGKLNQPAWIVEVVDTIAELKQVSADQVANVTSATAAGIFGLELTEDWS